jgi:hypothetical protein
MLGLVFSVLIISSIISAIETVLYISHGTRSAQLTDMADTSTICARHIPLVQSGRRTCIPPIDDTLRHQYPNCALCKAFHAPNGCGNWILFDGHTDDLPPMD